MELVITSTIGTELIIMQRHVARYVSFMPYSFSTFTANQLILLTLFVHILLGVCSFFLINYAYIIGSHYFRSLLFLPSLITLTGDCNYLSRLSSECIRKMTLKNIAMCFHINSICLKRKINEVTGISNLPILRDKYICQV